LIQRCPTEEGQRISGQLFLGKHNSIVQLEAVCFFLKTVRDRKDAMATTRCVIRGLRGWEDAPRAIRILEALPSVDEAAVDPLRGQAWARGPGPLPLLGMLEALHRAGYEAEAIPSEGLFPGARLDERKALRRLRATAIWTLPLLVLDPLHARGLWRPATAMSLLLLYLLTSGRDLALPSPRTLGSRIFGEDFRSGLALWLLVASLPLAWRAQSYAFFALPMLVAVLLSLSRWMELRWMRLLTDDGAKSDRTALSPEALGRGRSLHEPLRPLGDALLWVLPILILLRLAVALRTGGRVPAAGLLRGLAAVLLAGSGRALLLASPAAMAAGMARAATRGLIFQRAGIVEGLHRCRLLVFDRVGFLTRSRAEVETVKTFGGSNTERLYEETAGALAEATHPLMRALHRFTDERSEGRSRPLSVIRSPGAGLEAEVSGRSLRIGHPWFLVRSGVDMEEAAEALAENDERARSSIALSVDGRLRAVFGLRMEPRPEAKSLLRRLKSLGLGGLLLTGEGEALARRAAEEYGVEQFHAGLDGDGRARLLREKVREGLAVAAIGQDIHDAPVLAAADIPIIQGPASMGPKPGLILSSGRPGAVLDARIFARRVVALERQNRAFVGALIPVLLLSASLGLAGPLLCAAFRVLAIQAPLANSLRVRSFRFESLEG